MSPMLMGDWLDTSHSRMAGMSGLCHPGLAVKLRELTPDDSPYNGGWRLWLSHGAAIVLVLTGLSIAWLLLKVLGF